MVAASELTGKMMEKVRDENRAIWTYIIESASWEEHEETGKVRGRRARWKKGVTRWIIFPILPKKNNKNPPKSQKTTENTINKARAGVTHLPATPTC